MAILYLEQLARIKDTNAVRIYVCIFKCFQDVGTTFESIRTDDIQLMFKCYSYYSCH